MRRSMIFVCSTLFGIAGFFWALLRGVAQETAGLKFRRRWLERVPARLGLRMVKEGAPATGPCLFVANHISYIDPISILMYVDAKIVAKAEIANWPLVGYSANVTGTIFVQRDQKESRSNAANAVRDALFAGESILVFPEGTTSAGPLTLPFRPRTFDAAEEADVAVQPIAIFYEDPSVAYIGEDTFIPHILRTLRMKALKGRIVFGPIMHGPETCRRAKEWIDQEQSKFIKQTPQHEPA